MRNLLSYHWAPEPAPFTPGANTIFYFPFENDADDHSGNGFTLSTSGTQETIGRRFNTAVNFNKVPSKGFFGSYWMKIYTKGTGKTQAGNNAGCQVGFGTEGCLMYQGYNGWAPTYGERIQFVYNSSWSAVDYRFTPSIGVRHHIAYGYSIETGAVCWVDGEKHILTTSYSPRMPDLTTEFIVNTTDTKLDAAFSDLISETVIWTDEQVSDYFNATKSKYGIS